jgi:hypothetical protein
MANDEPSISQSLSQLHQHMLAVSAQLSESKLDYAGVHAIELAGAASMVAEWSREVAILETRNNG